MQTAIFSFDADVTSFDADMTSLDADVTSFEAVGKREFAQSMARALCYHNHIKISNNMAIDERKQRLYDATRQGAEIIKSSHSGAAFGNCVHAEAGILFAPIVCYSILRSYRMQR